MTKPTEQPRRSFVYRTQAGAGARFAHYGDTAIAEDFGASEKEIETARALGLTDLSPLPRCGFKGSGAPAWLREQGLQLPTAPNTALRLGNGMLVVALSAEEHLLLNPLTDADLCTSLDNRWSLDSAARCYALPRRDSHCWLAVTGKHTPAMLAKLCGVDLRLHKFADGGVAQTSLARINVIVVRCDLAAAPALYVLADSASAEYLWSCLVDAMAEFGGTPVGFNALRQLAQPS